MTSRKVFWISLCSALFATNAMVDGGIDKEVEKLQMLEGNKLLLTEVYRMFEDRFKAKDCDLFCDMIMGGSEEKYCVCGTGNEDANRKLAGYLNELGHQILALHNITDKVPSKDDSLLMVGLDGKPRWLFQRFFSALRSLISANRCPYFCKWNKDVPCTFRREGFRSSLNICGCRLVDVELDVKLANEAIIIANTMQAFYDSHK